MLAFLALAEWAILLLFAWRLVRRPADSTARARWALPAIAGLLALQAILFIAIPATIGWLFDGDALIRERVSRAGAALWLVQAARAAVLFVAAALWARFVSGGSTRAPAQRRLTLRSPAGVLGLAMVIELLQMIRSDFASLLALGALVVSLYVTPKEWISEIRGIRRLAALPLAFIAFLCVQDVVVSTLREHPSVNVPVLGSKQSALISGAEDTPLGPFLRVADPLTAWIRILSNLFAVQAFVALVRLPLPRRVLPTMSLRMLSLRRRFALTYGLIRLLPQALTTLIIAAALYFILGAHASGRVKSALESTLAKAQVAADRIAHDAPPAAFGSDRARAADLVADARRWLGADGARTHIVLRDAEGAAAAPRDTPAANGTSATNAAIDDDELAADEAGAHPVAADSARVIASPSAPPPLLAMAVRPSGGDAAWRGIVEAGGALYLLSARLDPAAGWLAMVCVALDSTYLAEVARDAGASVILETRPGTIITRDARQITIGRAQQPWTANAIRLAAPDPADTLGSGVLSRRRRFAAELLPVGDWTRPIRSRGAVGLRLETSVSRVLAELPAGIMAMLFAIGTPVVLIAIAALLATESIAVRAGRGIATSILSDIKTLSDAARRIGEGDLDHRVPVAGKDELSGLATAFNDMTASLKRHQEELLEKERIEADLAVARDIQMRLLPQGPPTIAGLDVAGVSIPSREVGGDLFCFLTLSDGRLGVALGDVSGKSVPAALLMSNVLASLKAHSQHGVAVGESLTRINRLLCDDILFGKFVTLFYAIVDARGGEIRYGSAGHNPPLMVRASGEVDWLREAWVPLGIQSEATYKEAVATLAPGDVLVIYSDGVTEAETVAQVADDLPAARATPSTSQVDGEIEEEDDLFGEERLARAVATIRWESAAGIVSGIERAVREFARGAPQADDITIVVVKMVAPPASRT